MSCDMFVFQFCVMCILTRHVFSCSKYNCYVMLSDDDYFYTIIMLELGTRSISLEHV